MKKKKMPLKLSKKVVSKLTKSQINGGGTTTPPSCPGSCFVNCGASNPGCQPTQSDPMFCYATNPGYCG